MRVLFITPHFSPRIGGVEKHVWELCNVLAAHHQITVVTTQHDSQLPQEESVLDSVRVLRIPIPSRASGFAYKRAVWQWWLRHLPLLLQTDITHIHDVFFWLLPLRPLLFWKKWFITFHGYEQPTGPTWKERFWHQLAAAWTNGNICIGRYHQRWYRVRPTAISYGAIAPLPTASLHWRRKEPNAVFVGRLDTDTGIMAYLEALKILKERDDFVMLFEVYGDGPQRQEAEAYAKKHQLPVIFHGWKKDGFRKFRTALIACASRYLSILEALSFGIPVVAHYDSNIKRDALLRSPFGKWIQVGHSAQELADAIQQAQTLPSAAQRWARQQTWEKLAKLYEGVWNSVK